MKRMSEINFVVLVLNFLILCACQPGGADTQEDEPTIPPGPAPFVCSIKDVNPVQPMLCLQQACDRVGGRYDHKAQACQCGAGLYFTGWEHPKCVAYQTELNCYIDQSAKPNCTMSSLKDGTGMALGALVLQQAGNSSMGSPYSDLQSQFPDWRKVRWSQALNRRMGNRILVYGPGQLTANQIRELVDPAAPQALKRQLGNLMPQDEYYYFATSDDLSRMFRGEDRFDHDLNETAPANLTTDFWQTLKTAHAVAAKQNLKMIETYSSSGCLGYCQLQAQDTVANFKLIHNVDYFGGVIGRRVVQLIDQNNKLRAALNLTAQGMVSTVMVFSQTNSHNQVQRSVQIFNRMGQNLGTTQERLLNLNTLLPQQIQLKAAQKATTVQAVVCDGGFNPEDFLQGSLKGLLQLGPNLSSDPSSDGSYYGWRSQLDEKTFTDGLIETGPFGFIQRQGQDLTEHGREVSKLVAGRSLVGIVPLPMARCDREEDFKILAPQLINRTRLINFSASSERQGDACELFSAHPINGSGRDFLWMVAAGNGGLRDERQLSQTCPQKFSGQKNVIVVAASDGRYSVHHESNAHPDYADIAAPGEVQEGQGWGTSFAAPKVTNLAAQIVSLYPKLTIEQIRLAILLGAKDVPYLPVRAEGILNAKDALKIADQLNRLGTNKIPQILNNVFCSWEDDCELQQRKLTIYRQRLM